MCQDRNEAFRVISLMIGSLLFLPWLSQKIPVLKVLARDSFCGCSPAEIRRMEKIILDKLNWDLHMATPLDFLHIVSKGPLMFFLLSVSANNVSRSTQTKIVPVGEQRPWTIFVIPLYL